MEFNEVFRKDKKKFILMVFFMVYLIGKKCIFKNKIIFIFMRFDYKFYFLYED